MKGSLAAVFQAAGRELELRRLSRPEPQGEEILVRVTGCTLCGSDLHSYSGRREVPVPTILGHEIVGEIEAFGEAAPRHDLAGQPLSLGDRLTWSIVAHCGACFYCRRELPQKCLAALKYGHEMLRPGCELSGGLAEHCLLAPGTALMRLPEELPLSVACPASCATATVAAALEAAGEVRDRNVCLFGAGLLGLTACAMLRVQGAATVACVDVNENRARRSLDFGATHALAPHEVAAAVAARTDGHGYDVVLELSGSSAACESGWQILRRGGTCVLVGAVFPTPAVAISPEQLVRRQLTLRGVHNYAPRHLRRAVEFLTAHHRAFPFADLVSQWYPLPESAAAFAAALQGSPIRVGVRPS